MNEDGQVMPSFDALTHKNYSPREWLQYYRNIWTRNLMGSMTDVQHDGMLLAADPEALTDGSGQNLIPDGKGGARAKTIAERIEERKANANRAIGIITSIDALMAKTDEELAAAILPNSDMLKPIEVPVETDAKLASFTVLPGKTVTMPDGEKAEGTLIDLDPESETAKAWLSEGLIAPTTASV